MRTLDIIIYIVAIGCFLVAAWLASKADGKWPIPLALGLIGIVLVPLITLINAK